MLSRLVPPGFLKHHEQPNYVCHLMLNAESTSATWILETPQATELCLSHNAVQVSTQAARVSESPNTTCARLTANASRQHAVKDQGCTPLSDIMKLTNFHKCDRNVVVKATPIYNLNVEDGTIHPSLTGCLHSALNGLPVILLYENQHFK